MRHLLPITTVVLAFAVTAYAQPPLVQYLFDQGGSPSSVINTGSIGGMDPIVGHDLTATSPNATPALNGVLGSGNRITSGFTPNFGNSDWTLGFGIDTSGNNAAFQYTTGATITGTTSEWRSFVSGAAGTGNIILRGPSASSVPDTIIPGGGGQTGWVHVAWVYDSTAGEIRGYLNGSLAVVEPAGPLNVVASNALKVGNVTSTSSSSLDNGTKMEDFRIYDRALSATEIESWTCSVLAASVASEWETNGPKADLSVDGTSSPAVPGPIIVNKNLGMTAVVGLNSTLTGNPWDLGVTSPEVPVPLSGAGLQVGICPSETINLDLSAPSLFFLNSLAFNNAFTNQVFNVQSATTFDISAQMVVIDPGSPVGLQLSAPIELHWAPAPCIVVKASGSNSFNSDTSSGYWSVTHDGSCADWIESVTLDFSQAAAGTPAASQEFDTDQSGMADRFDGGNSTVSGCLGTYRNGSDVATGLIYTGTPASPCDPNANTGWVGTNPGGSTNDWLTLSFSFTPNMFNGQTFEFDADTDGGGISGDAMAGTVVTITVNDGTGPQTLTGTLSVDPNNANTSFVTFL